MIVPKATSELSPSSKAYIHNHKQQQRIVDAEIKNSRDTFIEQVDCVKIRTSFETKSFMRFCCFLIFLSMCPFQSFVCALARARAQSSFYAFRERVTLLFFFFSFLENVSSRWNVIDSVEWKSVLI